MHRPLDKADAALHRQTKTDSLRAQMEQIAFGIPARVGAAAMLIETSESAAVSGDGHFPMQSVYKFPIAMAALREE